MKRYRFLDQADIEFQEHISYYDAQTEGLGEKLAYVDTIRRAIGAGPGADSSVMAFQCEGSSVACSAAVPN